MEKFPPFSWPVPHGVLLIGWPASGKSTFAATLAQRHPYHRISSDRIRHQLWGKEAIQGDWSMIQREIDRQLQFHLLAGHSVIYDATNAQRSWREDFLQRFKALTTMPIMGCYLCPPLALSEQWNQRRSRQVPPAVLQAYYQALTQDPPTVEEGFTALYRLEWNAGQWQWRN